MLAKVCLKRFRFVLYAALFFLITLQSRTAPTAA